jgi:hypothetical protein
MDSASIYIASVCISLLCTLFSNGKLKAFMPFYYFCYIVGLIAISIGIYLFIFYSSIGNVNGWISIGSGGVLLIMTFIFSKNIDVIDTKNIVPKVIKFTETAKKDEIYLLGGDLDFFGNPKDMDGDKQYKQLINKKFNKILILCEKPTQSDTEQRYGKILKDFNHNVEMRFYNCNAQDAHIRGRIKWKLSPHIQQSLIYERIDSNKYRIIEEDITCKEGNIGNPYVNIWDLLWKSAEILSDSDKQAWIATLDNINQN